MEFSIEKYQELVIDKGTHVVQNKRGESIRIVCTNKRGALQPVIGLVDLGHKEGQREYHTDGKYREDKWDCDGNLVIVPKPPVSLGWYAIGKDGYPTTGYYPTRKAFDLAYGPSELLSEPIEIFAKPNP